MHNCSAVAKVHSPTNYLRSHLHLGCEARGAAYHQGNRLLVTTCPAAPFYVVKGHPVPPYTSPELPHLLLEK